MYDNVEVSGSSQRSNGTVAQAIIFAAYIVSLTILAILAVQPVYFFAVVVVGLPATGVIQFLQSELRARRWVKLEQKQNEIVQPIAQNVPIQAESATDSAGNPVIYL